MGRKRDLRDATEFDAKPPTSRYTHVCKLCWPPKAGDDDSESGEASSAHTGDGEEPWYEGTWSWEVAPWGWGRRTRGSPDRSGYGAKFESKTLYDFIRERM